MQNLTHLAADGTANMVDVSAKPILYRRAEAAGHIALQRETLKLIKENTLKKGDVLCVARIAGIQAAKQTSALIPLCHHLNLSKVQVDFSYVEDGIEVRALAITQASTGVEMEALTAVSVALLTIYDMCKAVDQQMVMGQIRLIEKLKQEVP